MLTRAHGIDVSHWKTVKNWDAVVASGVSFVGMKASEGMQYIDPTLRGHRDQARLHPFTLLIYYHFARGGDPAAQAERLQDVVGPLQDNERLCLDLEVSPTADPKNAIGWVDKFITTLADGACSDRRPLLYTSKRIWRTLGDPDWDLAGEVDLWVPRYNAQGIEPAVPKPWANVGWSFWQYSDGEFPPVVTPGVGKCDANYFWGDQEELEEFARLGPGAVGPDGVG